MTANTNENSKKEIHIPLATENTRTPRNLLKGISIKWSTWGSTLQRNAIKHLENKHASVITVEKLAIEQKFTEAKTSIYYLIQDSERQEEKGSSEGKIFECYQN